MKFKIILLLILIVNQAFAQKKEFRDTEVDTLTFLNNIKLLNSLNTNAFQKKTFAENEITIPYRFLTPKNNLINQKYPLVITFHNSTRIGNDNENQLEPFAAIVSVAAVPDLSNLTKIKEKNIWLIHGKKMMKTHLLAA